jgi:hypothetical protein
MKIGRAWIAALMCGFLAAGVVGCGDDDSGNNNQQQDAALSDAAPPTDGTTGGDGDTEWDCSQIGLCAADCGTDFGCLNDCKNHGCQSAQDAYDAVQNCVLADCFMECAGDPQGQECQDCRNANCPTEIAACEANTCP